MSQRYSEFPVSQSGLNDALSNEPVLFNGMKLIFDQSASVYPVDLQSTIKGTQFSVWQTFSESKSIYSSQLALEKSTIPADWDNYNKPAQEQYKSDTELWLKTLYPTRARDIPPERIIGADEASENENARKATYGLKPDSLKYPYKTAILERLFLTLGHGGLQYRQNNKDPLKWKDWDKPLASALSHGGRVLIRVPNVKSYAPHAIWNWLITGQENDGSSSSVFEKNTKARLFPRRCSTHLISVSDDKGPYEVKAKTTNMEGNYGMNLAMGGLMGKGRDNLLILPDGLHGHLYLNYTHFPGHKNWFGAILVGAENAAPVPNFFGFEENMFPFPIEGVTHLGTGHDPTGKAQSTSLTGGRKWENLHPLNDSGDSKEPSEEIEIRDAKGVPGKIDCMRLDMDTEKFEKIKGLHTTMAEHGMYEEELVNLLLPRTRRGV